MSVGCVSLNHNKRFNQNSGKDILPGTHRRQSVEKTYFPEPMEGKVTLSARKVMASVFWMLRAISWVNSLRRDKQPMVCIIPI